MSVDFSDSKTAWYGKTKLTKVIHRNGFGIATSASVGEVGKAIELTCEQYPEKKAIFRQIMKPIASLEGDHNVISYGAVSATLAKAGKEKVVVPQWKLGLAGPIDSYKYRIVLMQAKLFSGKIAEVEELGHFINELERNLRDIDPGATIDLLGLQQ
jgi:hypothetical protein